MCVRGFSTNIDFCIRSDKLLAKWIHQNLPPTTKFGVLSTFGTSFSISGLI